MLIPNKFNGYSRDGIRTYHMGGGGGGGGGGTSTQVVDLPEWAKPTAQKQLALTESTTDINKNPFQSFGGIKDASGKQVGFDASKLVAGMDPLQQRAYQGAGNLQVPGATGQGIDFAQQATQRALNMGYGPGQFQNQFQAPGQFDPGQFRAERASTQSFRQPGSAEAYMDPYMQNVVGIQQREAQRAADIAGTQRGAQAVGSGAFGGSRQAIMDAEAARNLAQQKGDIQARGLQSAFQNAQQQFNAEQAAALQAQLANQQTGLTAQQLGEQSRQFGAGQGMTAAQAAAQYGQSAQQLAEQSRQFGGSLGLQGLQAAMTGAGQLGALGGQQFGQQKDILGLQNQFGAQQQAQEQARINAEAQNFAAQQRYPYQQLEFMSNILRGTPMGTVQSMYQAQPSTASQLLGAGTMLGGAYLSGGRKEGGIISSYAKGGAVKKKSAGLAELALSKI